MYKDLSWLGELVKLERTDAIDLVYRTLDDLHRAGRFMDSNAALENFPVDEVAPSVLLSVLTITKGVELQTPYRATLVHKIRARIIALGHGESETDDMMSGIE